LDAWNDLARQDRGPIVTHAYEHQRRADVARITVALGLTHAEAGRLAVRY
jgi:hypothetical protein